MNNSTCYLQFLLTYDKLFKIQASSKTSVLVIKNVMFFGVLMNFFENEKRKINRGALELQRRRVNWSLYVRQQVIDCCNEMADYGNSNGYPYRLFCYQGSTDTNSETVQFGVGINHTGIERVEHKVTGAGVSKTKQKILEKGCALVFSQGPTGHIAVMIYPYKSDVIERKENYIFLYSSLEPEKLTDKRIKNAVLKCLFYARVSSVVGLSGSVTKLDRLKLFFINFNDIRSRNNRREAMTNLTSEWWKLAFTAVMTFVVTILAQHYLSS